MTNLRAGSALTIWLVLCLAGPLYAADLPSQVHPVVIDDRVAVSSKDHQPGAAGHHGCTACCGAPHCSGCGIVDGHARAGFPHRVSRLAAPSVNHKYSVGYVGGGAALFGEPRYCHEGTFGLDYSGLFGSKRIWLHWWHGRRAQGGAGAYKTDGPHLIHHH